MPIFGTERELVGFRGFGLIKEDALDDLGDDEQPREACRPVIAEIDAGATGTAVEPVGDDAPPSKGNLSSNSAELSDEARSDADELLIEFEPAAPGLVRPVSKLSAPGWRISNQKPDLKQPVSNLSLRLRWRRKPSEISPTTRNSSSNFAKPSQPRYPNRPSSFTGLPRPKTRKNPSQRPLCRPLLATRNRRRGCRIPSGTRFGKSPRPRRASRG